MDLTWDCNNQYWGEGSSKNKSGQKCTYDNYGIPAYRMGLGHKPSEKGAVSYSNTIKGIIVEDTKEKYACGDDISKDYKLYLQTLSGLPLFPADAATLDSWLSVPAGCDAAAFG